MASQTTSTKIKETITKITELEAVRRHFDTTMNELDRILDQKDKVENQMVKELEDINKLEKLGMKSIFYKVLGSKEDQLEKERQEYLQVTLQHKDLLNAVEVAEFEKGILEKKLVVMDRLELELESLKEKRASEIMSQAGPLRNELTLMYKKMDQLKRYEIELKEALNAGEKTQHSLKVVYDHMKKAKEWGSWDMMSGNKNGRYHKSMKHSSIDKAMYEVPRSQLLLRTFNKEMSDIGYANSRLGLQIDSIAKFPGMIFDNLISDWIVQNKIKGALASVSNILDDVKLIMGSINKDRRTAGDQFIELESDVNRLLEEN